LSDVKFYLHSAVLLIIWCTSVTYLKCTDFFPYSFNDIAPNVRRVCVQSSQEFLVNHPGLVKDIAGNTLTSILLFCGEVMALIVYMAATTTCNILLLRCTAVLYGFWFHHDNDYALGYTQKKTIVNVCCAWM